MSARKTKPGPAIELWIATIGIGAFLLGGLVDIDRSSPRIGTVRLDDLAAEMIEQSTRGENSDQAIAEAARAWAVELEKALDGIAERDSVVLFPAEVVAAGAPDYTARVREAMVAWERTLAEPGGASDEHGARAPEDQQ